MTTHNATGRHPPSPASHTPRGRATDPSGPATCACRGPDRVPSAGGSPRPGAGEL